MTNMGLGPLGKDDIIFKRKFRWGLTIDTCANTIDEHLVKLASRPNLSIEETEINMKHAKTWIPGKASWETITVTYYDVVDQELQGLYAWLGAVYNFLTPNGILGNSADKSLNLTMGSKLRDYRGIATLRLYDGCGETVETWKLRDAWPQSVNFGDLDYSSSEEVTIEMTLRYSDVSYVSHCTRAFQCACTSC